MKNILTIEAVVAVERNQWGIGAGNELLWRLPKDMRRFREITKEGAVIMGTKTALSVGRALPRRINYVLTRRGVTPYEGQIPVASVQEAVNHLMTLPGASTGRRLHLFVLGGEEVYTHTLPYLTGIHLTVVYSGGEVLPDRFFPMGSLMMLHDFKLPEALANMPEGAIMDGVAETIPTHYMFDTWPAMRGPALLSLPKSWQLGGYRTMDQ